MGGFLFESLFRTMASLVVYSICVVFFVISCIVSSWHFLHCGEMLCVSSTFKFPLKMASYLLSCMSWLYKRTSNF